MPLTNESCPETKKGCFSRIWIQFSSLKTKKTQKSQSSALSRELCITILSAPSLLTCLGDFLASYCISLCLSQHSSSSPENAAITQSIWNWERERGRKAEICLPTHHHHLYTPSDKQQNETNLPGDCTSSCIFRGKPGAKTRWTALESESRITCALFCLTLSTPLPHTPGWERISSWSEVSFHHKTRCSCSSPEYLPGSSACHLIGSTGNASLPQNAAAPWPLHLSEGSQELSHVPELIREKTMIWKHSSLNWPLLITGSNAE